VGAGKADEGIAEGWALVRVDPDRNEVAQIIELPKLNGPMRSLPVEETCGSRGRPTTLGRSDVGDACGDVAADVLVARLLEMRLVIEITSAAFDSSLRDELGRADARGYRGRV